MIRAWEQRRWALILVVGIACLSFSLVSCSSIKAEETTPVAESDLDAEVLQIIRDNPDVILEALQNYQREQQREQLAQQRANNQALQSLKQDPQSYVGESPLKGAEDARIVLFEFSDFQCPFCARVNPTLDDFMAAHGDEVALVFKHLPLVQLHPEAIPAARAAWAAQQQGKFWEYHDLLFERQQDLSDAMFMTLAEELDLDIEQFNEDRQSDASQAAVDADLALAGELELRGTPSFVMNGEVFSGALPLEEFERILDKVKDEQD